MLLKPLYPFFFELSELVKHKMDILRPRTPQSLTDEKRRCFARIS